MKFSSTFPRVASGNDFSPQILTLNFFLVTVILFTLLGEHSDFEDKFPAVKKKKKDTLGFPSFYFP